MKPSEITTEQFENWKNDCRLIFKDNPDSMNLINIYLKLLDKGEIDRNKDLMEFYKNDLAHAGELHCEECGEKMTVYYTVQCFKCKKPTEANYLMCAYWLKNNEPEFNEDKHWDEICEVLSGNDSFCLVPDTNSNESKLFKKHFNINIPYLFSW